MILAKNFLAAPKEEGQLRKSLHLKIGGDRDWLKPSFAAIRPIVSEADKTRAAAPDDVN